MHPVLAFYKQTWWLWLIFVGVFAALSYYVSPLFVVMVPGIIAYSIYFCVVRVSEMNERERDLRRVARPTQAAAASPSAPPVESNDPPAAG